MKSASLTLPSQIQATKGDCLTRHLLRTVLCGWLSALALSVVSLSPVFAGVISLAGVSDQYLAEGQTMSIVLEASDSEGAVVSLGLSRRPLGATIVDLGDGRSLCAWSSDYIGPNSSSGSPFEFEFVADNGLERTIAIMKVFVQDVNRRPTISAPDTVFVEVGDSALIRPTASDPDYDFLRWSVIESPLGSQVDIDLGVSGVSFNWAPIDSDSGVSALTLVATDSWGLADTVTTQVVVSVGPPFSLSIANDTAFPGEVITLPVSLKNREEIGSFDLRLHFDPSVMSFISIELNLDRLAEFESFSYELNSPAPGDLRVVGISNLAAGPVSPPLGVGDGPLFELNLYVSSTVGLAGLFLPVEFLFREPAAQLDNTMTDTTGAVIESSDIVFVNGGTKVRDNSAITRGDINLNGVPFEVSDALRFTNYFIDPIKYGFNAQQFANSDINRDGIVASIADLVTLITIVTGGGSSTRIVPGSTVYQATAYSALDSDMYSLRLETDISVSALYAEFAINEETSSGVFEVTLNAELQRSGMQLISQRNGNTVRALIYSLSGASVPSSSAAILNIPTANRSSLTLVRVEMAASDGSLFEVNLGRSAALPEDFTLSQNYPNPFNPSTKISFDLKKMSDVRLVIYDALGRTVITLVEGRYEAGSYTVSWNGRTESGSTVASGIYFYRLTNGVHTLSRKMALLK